MLEWGDKILPLQTSRIEPITRTRLILAPRCLGVMSYRSSRRSLYVSGSDPTQRVHCSTKQSCYTLAQWKSEHDPVTLWRCVTKLYQKSRPQKRLIKLLVQAVTTELHSHGLRRSSWSTPSKSDRKRHVRFPQLPSTCHTIPEALSRLTSFPKNHRQWRSDIPE